MPPQLDEERAKFVLSKVEQILEWERQTDKERDTRFVELGRYLCEVRAGQYWRVQRLKSFDEYLSRHFPESRRKAYYLMSIHEQLPRDIRKELKQIGSSKAAEMAKVARKDGQEFNCANWLHKAQTQPIQQFKDDVQQYLTGDSEPSELIFFKVFRSQLPVIEQASEVAARMLGSDRSRGYCLEMICADFLAGAQLGNAAPEALLQSICRLFQFLPRAQQGFCLDTLRSAA
jgi:hypothetical protein